MKRMQSIILFIAIATLLTAKAGFTFWQSFTDDFQPGESVLTASALTASTQAPAMAHSLTLHHERADDRTQGAAPATTIDSWAMLETYLIPEAGAASSPQRGSPLIEDKTLTSLRQYKDKLEHRSKKLDAREKSLQQAESKLKQRITELEQLEASIQQRLADESKIKNKKIKRLTAVYEGMKPERAAAVIEKMNLATVVKIFLLMDEKKVGKILSFLPPDQAVTISQALTRQISSVQ